MTACALITCAILLGCSRPSPIVEIKLETSETLDFEKKKQVGLLHVMDGDTVRISGTAKWRGGWSRQFDKKSFSLDTEYPIPLAGMPAHTKWILNASYIDKTMIRHRLWYELWQSMDSSNVAAACKYVTLTVDDRYQGLYIAMERIHESRCMIQPDGVLFKDPQVFRKDSIPPEKGDSYFHQKYPDPEINNKDDLLFDLKNFIQKSNSTSFAQQIDEYVDLDNIIDWHLLLLLSHNADGLVKNFYLYKKSASDLFKIIPWDYDHSAGRDGDNELNLNNTMIQDQRNILLDRLMKSNAKKYNDHRCQRWWTLRKLGIFSKETMSDRISQMQKEIDSEIKNNFTKWPYGGPGYYDTNDHYQEVELMKSYIEQRIDFLDNYFDCNK